MKKLNIKPAVQFCFLFILCILFFTKIDAQEVITSAGAYSSTGSGSLSWTIGEGVTETFSNSNYTLTQGFQQSRLTVTAIDEIANLSFVITAFPNPATDYIQLKVGTKDFQSMDYQLFDTSGKMIARKQLEECETEISLNELPPAVYFLKITESNMLVKTFKIIKK